MHLSEEPVANNFNSSQEAIQQITSKIINKYFY